MKVSGEVVELNSLFASFKDQLNRLKMKYFEPEIELEWYWGKV